MALYLSPLVDINEVDLTTTIPAVATSLAVIAIKDPFKGPELKRKLITNIEELIDTFGEPTSGSYRDIIAATGYLKFGNKLYATAVFSPSATFAGTHGTLTSASSGVSWSAYDTTDTSAYQLSDLDSEDPDEFGNEDIVFDSTRADYTSDIAFIAKTRGKWGNFIKLGMVGKNVYDTIRKGTSTYDAIGISQDLYNDIAAVDVSFDSSTDTEMLLLVKVADQDQVNKTTPVYSLKEAWLVSTDDKKLDDEGGNIFCETYLEQVSKYIRCSIKEIAKNRDLSEAFTADYQQFGGGQNAAGSATENIWNTAMIDAYELYEDPETIDINILIDSDKSTTVKQELISIAEDRKDCMAILDVPSSLVVNNRGNEATDMRDFRLGLHSTYNLQESSLRQ